MALQWWGVFSHSTMGRSGSGNGGWVLAGRQVSEPSLVIPSHSWKGFLTYSIASKPISHLCGRLIYMAWVNGLRTSGSYSVSSAFSRVAGM